jgi:Fur family ferric uptake transcriptional regulator
MAQRHISHPYDQALQERLRQLGLRVTPQRLLVLEALSSSTTHITADEIMRWTAQRYPAINLATIYRTLDVLTSAGLVSQTDLGSGASEYELVGDSVHHHLVCERCGAVTEIDDTVFVPVRERLLRDFGFRVSARHIGLFGLCKACLATSRPTRQSEPAQSTDTNASGA